jgi:CDP-glucose 4,6-dehydratase
MGPRERPLATMALNPSFWTGRRILVTGHTGFKGGWLTAWLSQLGAQVHGYALAAPTPSLWHAARLSDWAPGTLADIGDSGQIAAAVTAFQPSIVLHLAAQPLVRASYATPAETYATNVMGTVHLLEAVRHCPSVQAMVVITSDKCYDNQEWPWPYREQDALGGHDPYSSSKACVELLCASWRSSFFASSGMQVATARAGNVIGGGDWSPDRLVPDAFRAWDRGETLTLRYPHAIRPWQHVLDPLHGYLLLAQALVERGSEAATAWNFGPDTEGVASVAEVVGQLATLWPSPAPWHFDMETPQPHEAGLLTLDSAKARRLLGWRPRWTLAQTLERTVAWHSAWRAGADMQAITHAQIADFQNSAP